MNSKRQHLFRALLLTGAMALTVPQAVLALTPPCTQINNRAFVDYQVGGVNQSQIGSKDPLGNINTSFYVGVKVDVVVTKNDNSIPTVAPTANATMTFSVLNNGNAPMQYALTAARQSGANSPSYTTPPTRTTDNFLATIVSVNGTAGLTANSVTVNPGASIDIPVIVTIPAGQANNDLTVWSLVAQSKLAGAGTISITAKNSTAKGTEIGGATCNALPGTVDIDVVAGDGKGTDDGATNDGAHSARDAVQVTAAGLTITKSSAVYWDPVNFFSSPKAIPGAVVTYTITIANASGAATATNIKVVDDLSGAITAGVIFGNGSTDAGQTDTNYNDGTTSCLGGSARGILVGTTCKTNLYSANNDDASWNDPLDVTNGGANKVAVIGLSVAGGAQETVKYQVTIQ